jgi:uncharacterized protein
MDTTSALHTLILPGWQDSGPAHWQSRWEALHGFHRVQQADWWQPLRGDWMMQLEQAVLESDRPIRLAAHSLGCHLAAAWAAHSQHAHRVQAALLVAPPDLDAPDLPPQLHSWRPPVRQRLPFPSLLVYSLDDPFGRPEQAATLAADWGCATLSLGARGHLNAESGLGDWPEGIALLDALAAAASR